MEIFNTGLWSKNAEKSSNLVPNAQKLSDARAFSLMIKYVKDNQLTKLKSLLDSRDDREELIHRFDEQGMNVLHHASRQNNYNIISYLIRDLDMDVNCKTSQNMTPLHYAARFPSKAMLDITGYNVNEFDKKMKRIHRKDSLQSNMSIKSSQKESLIDLFKKNLMDKRQKEAVNLFATKLDKQFPQISDPIDEENEDDYNLDEDDVCEIYEYDNEFSPPKEVRIALQNDDHVFNKVVNLMINLGAEVNSQDSKGCTPLHYAIDKNNESAVLQLVYSVDTDIDDKDKLGNTPLHKSMAQNLQSLVRILLFVGANAYCVNFESETPLHVGARSGSLESTKILLSFLYYDSMEESILNEVDKRRYTALHSAVANKRVKMAEYLLEQSFNFLAVTNENERIFHLAVKSESSELVRMLIDKNLVSEDTNTSGFKPVHLAAMLADKTILEMILKLKTNPNERSWQQQTPLLIAMQNDREENIRTLRKYKAKENITDSKFKNCVTVGAKYGSINSLKVFFENPENINLLNAADINNNTPFHFASKYGKSDCLKLFNELRPLNMKTKNDFNQTPLHLAAMKGHSEVIDIIGRENNVDDIDDQEETPMHKAALNGHLEAVNSLLKFKPDLTKLDYRNYTPLTSAARNGYEDVVALLIEHGAEINPSNEVAFPALHAACRYGHERIVKYLLDNGADPSIRIRTNDVTIYNGSNALDVAIAADQMNSAKILIWTPGQIPNLLRNRFMDYHKKYSSTLRELIKYMPKLAYDVFDWCITSEGKSIDHIDFKVKFDFELLDDTFCVWNTYDESSLNSKGQISQDNYYNVYETDGMLELSAEPYQENPKDLYEVHPLLALTESDESDIIEHPLVHALIIEKWKGFGFAFYHINLLLYILFLVLFNFYMIINKPSNNFYNDSVTFDAYCASDNSEIPSFELFVLQILILVTCIISLIKESYQIFKQKQYYFMDWDNYLEIFSYIGAVLVVIDIVPCQKDKGIRLNWQWELGTLAILTAWFTFFVFLQKIPIIGLYMIMFVKVTKTFFMLFLIFFNLLVTYALPYHLLFSHNPSFSTPFYSIIKVLVMTTGEVDYGDIFYNEEYQITYPVASYGIFFTFIIFMNIILMNLTVGLAIDDIGEIMNQAKLNHEAMRIKICLETEQSLPQSFLKKRIRKYSVVYPNRKLNWFNKLKNFIFTPKMPDFRSPRWMSKNVETTESKLNNVIKEIRTLKDELNTVQNNSNNLEQISSKFVY